MVSDLPVFLLVIPLEEEFAFIHEAFRGQSVQGPDGYEIFRATTREYQIEYFCVRKMGNIGPAIATSKLLRDHAPDAIVVFGVGGSLVDNLEVGSVAIADSIFYYEHAKITEEQNHYRSSILPVDQLLLRIANGLRPELDFQTQTGLFAVGEKVIAADQEKEKILAAQPKAIVVEMESQGVLEAINDSSALVRFISIRCISDKANHTKDDSFRKHALTNGVQFIKALLHKASSLLSNQKAKRLGRFLAVHHTSQGRRPFLPFSQSFLDYFPGYELSIFEIDQNQFYKDGRVYCPEAAAEILSVRLNELKATFNPAENIRLGYFGLANIPFALAVGYELQRVQIHFFELGRYTGSWEELNLGGPASILGVTTSQFAPQAPDAVEAILKIGISASIADKDICFIDSNVPRYSVEVPAPQKDLVVTREHLAEISQAFRRQLTQIKVNHPNIKTVHLFAAVPPSCAVSLGQQIAKTDDPAVIVYNYSRKESPFYSWGLELGSNVIYETNEAGEE